MFKLLKLLIGWPVDDEDPRSDWELAGGQGVAKSFLPPYPGDHQIYISGMILAGISFRKQQALAFVRGRDQTIGWEREPNNPHDPNAIKIFGICGRGQMHVGYVPKEAAAHIARSGMFDVIRPRLERIYESDARKGDPFVEIRFQIIGPKARNAEFHAAPARRRRSPKRATTSAGI